MKTHTNFMFLIVGTLVLAIGYFYTEKKHPEVFQDLMNKINQVNPWKSEDVPQDAPKEDKVEKDKVEDEEAPAEEVKPVQPKEEKPTDEELLPPPKKDSRQKNRPRPSLLIEE